MVRIHQYARFGVIPPLCSQGNPRKPLVNPPRKNGHCSPHLSHGNLIFHSCHYNLLLWPAALIPCASKVNSSLAKLLNCGSHLISHVLARYYRNWNNFMYIYICVCVWFYSERPRGAGFRSVNPAERWRENPASGILATPRVRDSLIWIQPRGVFRFNPTPGS